MGKSRRNRASHARANPVAGPPKTPKPAKAPADPALAALREAAVLPVVRDLRSANPATRTAAAGAIANLVTTDDAGGRCRKLLLREQVVHVVLTETLTDAGVESRAAGWAVLAVLALHEAPDFCVHLYRCDVLTPVAHALGQVVDALGRSGSSSKAEMRYVWNIATAVLDLVGHLADARDEILDAILGNAAIIRGFVTLATGVVPGRPDGADAVAIPYAVQWAALAGLGRLLMGADGEPVPAKKPQQPSQQHVLATMVVEDGPVFSVLMRLGERFKPLGVAAASLLHAVFAALEWFDHSPGPNGACDAVLIPTLSAALGDELVKHENRRRDVTRTADGQAQGISKPNSQKAAKASAPKEDGQADDQEDEQVHADEVCSLALQTLAMMGTTLKASLEKANRVESVWDGIQDDDGNDLAIDGEDEEDEEEEEGEDEEMTDGLAATRPKRTNGKHGGGGDGMDIDNDDDDDGDDNDDDNDDDDQIDLDRDMENVTGADDAADDDALADIATLHAFTRVAIPEIIRWIAVRREWLSAALASPSAPAEADPLVLEALAVLNNCAWTLACVDPDDTGNEQLLQDWAETANVVWKTVVRPLLPQAVLESRLNRPLAGPLAGLAWALARVLRGNTPVDAGEIDRFVALHRLSSGSDTPPENGDAAADDDNDPFQSLPVKCLGVLSQLAQGDSAPLDRNRAIGRYLVGVVAALPATPAAEAVEALNQLFDLYGDETAACDRAVFWAEGFLEALTAAMAPVRALAKTVDKRTHAELRTRADEAVLNLGRFLQYKRKHAP